MNRSVMLFILLFTLDSQAQQTDDFDYFAANRTMIRNGVQAVLMCNGLLYQQGGIWQGERLISEQWIKFERTPAPATAQRGNMYGGQFWLVPDERDDVPKTAYATAGNRGQFVVIVPSHDTVIVRRGLDFGKQGFDRWDLTREVLKAIERPPSQ